MLVSRLIRRFVEEVVASKKDRNDRLNIPVVRAKRFPCEISVSRNERTRANDSRAAGWPLSATDDREFHAFVRGHACQSYCST